MSRVSRNQVLLLWFVFVPLMFAGFPLLLSLLGPLTGWKDNAPNVLNLIGILPLVAGVIFAIWALAVQYRAAEKGWNFTLRPEPEFLLKNGPYAISRNPMYTGGMAAWLGWSLLLGSIPVLLGGTAFWGYMAGKVVKDEEKVLEERFGEEYQAYKEKVARWIGFPK